MYSRPRLAQKYLQYYLSAANGKGHGIHSPFVYDFVRNVLNDRTEYPPYARVEALRGQLERDRTLLEVEDLGAGSALQSTRQRSVGDIARHAAKSKKLGQLLYRITRYYRPAIVLELGTSLGLSTAYLSAGAADGAAARGTDAKGGAGGKVTGTNVANTAESDGSASGRITGANARVYTIEGAAAVAAVAEKNLRSLGCDNVRPVIGNFDDRIETVLDKAGGVDLAFVDGNHRLQPTLRYFNLLMSRSSGSAILIFDDIHWSREMEDAWDAIKQDPRVYCTIDLFFIGLVVLREEFKVKQEFVIRF